MYCYLTVAMVQPNPHQFAVLLQYDFRINKGEQVLDHLARNLDLLIVSGVQTVEHYHQINIPKHQDKDRMGKKDREGENEKS